MAKTKTAPEKTPAGITGTYKYDRKTGEVVRVSDGVPKVASKGRAAPKTCETSGGPCCGGGACGA
ncbi:MAG: hypothetical protein KGM24_07615 [Elusimicrobia bacterium]|nr:hypothetical protein [Elusimicrobiota bacterium]